MAVQINRKRVQEPANVTLITPQGGEITVTRSRAEALLARDPIGYNDGVYRKYAPVGESNIVEFAKPAETAAAPPRTGSKVNTPAGGE